MKKLTKFAAVAAALCLGAALLAGCSGSTTRPITRPTMVLPPTPMPRPSSWAWTTYPPYAFIGGDGNLTGFDIDLATEVAARNGWNLELEGPSTGMLRTHC